MFSSFQVDGDDHGDDDDDGDGDNDYEDGS